MIFEGFSSTPYDCPGGRTTIGYGHVLRDNEQHIREISQEEAIELLRKDCTEILIKIQKMIKVELSVNQMAALVSLCYNIGPDAFRQSTLRRKINRREYAANEFMRWAWVGNKKLTGLKLRRNVEYQLFLDRGVYARKAQDT